MSPQMIGAPAEFSFKMFQGSGASGIPAEYRQTGGMVLQMQRTPAAPAAGSSWRDITGEEYWSGSDPYTGTQRAAWSDGQWVGVGLDDIRVYSTDLYDRPGQIRVTFGETGDHGDLHYCLVDALRLTPTIGIEALGWNTTSGEAITLTWDAAATYAYWWVYVYPWPLTPDAHTIDRIEIPA